MRTLVTLTFLAFACLCSAQGEPSIQPVSAQEDRKRLIATRVFEEIFNQRRFEAASEIYAPEFRNHGRLRDFNLEEDQAAVHLEKQAFPDLKMTVNLLVAQGDFVSVVWTFRGTSHRPRRWSSTNGRQHCHARHYYLAHTRWKDPRGVELLQ
jgi:predicted ester cyclase